MKFVSNSSSQTHPQKGPEAALLLAQGSRRGGGGELLEFNGTQAFLCSASAKGEGLSDCWPDIQFIFRDPGLYNPDLKYFLMVGGMRPKSFGEMWYNTTAHLLGETDYTKLGHPNFRYFTDSSGSDMKVLIEGIRIGVRVLTETAAFAGEALSLDRRQVPSICAQLDDKLTSDVFWDCFIRRKAVTIDHLGGTCKMGSDTDGMAVVDSKLRVRGVLGLRVVDASVMPQVTNSNTNAPTIAIAEKAAAELWEEYGHCGRSKDKC